jgi:2-polyprenyl-3-methyl-5-hydroxy-6-metoxy-1,4-benzoquinol methylase
MPIPTGLAVREGLTPAAMWDRYQALCKSRPALRTTHYILGHKEAQLEWLHSVGVASDATLAAFAAPIPPDRLRTRVADPDLEPFLWTGFVDVVRILSLFHQHQSVGTAEPFDVLDFGCGCGRMLRFLHAVPGRWRAHGADTNPDLVEWCRSHLTSTPVSLNPADGPLEASDLSFDLVYCLSVFTHLAEDQARVWLAELARVLRPGGIVVATTHGQVALDTIRASTDHQAMFSMTREQAARLADDLPARGFVHLRYDQATLDVANAGRNYGNAFVDPGYVSRVWTVPSFEVCEVLPGGLRGWQDIVVLRKRLPTHS